MMFSDVIFAEKQDPQGSRETRPRPRVGQAILCFGDGGTDETFRGWRHQPPARVAWKGGTPGHKIRNGHIVTE